MGAIDETAAATDSLRRMNRRLWINLLTAGALLGQALAPAWAAGSSSHDSMAVQEQAIPCHPDTSHEEPAGNCCCNLIGDCAAACGGFALVTAFPQLPGAWADHAVTGPLVPAAAPAHQLSLLRPPIASQT